jgi:hypothetical protein
MAFGALLGIILSRGWRRHRVAGKLNALIAADPPQPDFEREKARIAVYGRGLASAAALIGALAGTAIYGALIGILWLAGRA